MKYSAKLLTVLAILLVPMVACADHCDDLSTIDNFSSGFNGATASSDGSMVTITQGSAAIDSGIDWRPAGTGFFSYSDESVVTLTPLDDPSNNAEYNTNILFFDSSGGFLAEVNWLPTSTGTSTESIDVTTLLSNPDADQFFVRFRVLGDGGTTKVFDKFSAVSAVPEPSAALLLGSMFAVIASRRRRR